MIQLPRIFPHALTIESHAMQPSRPTVWPFGGALVSGTSMLIGVARFRNGSATAAALAASSPPPPAAVVAADAVVAAPAAVVAADAVVAALAAVVAALLELL